MPQSTVYMPEPCRSNNVSYCYWMVLLWERLVIRQLRDRLSLTAERPGPPAPTLQALPLNHPDGKEALFCKCSTKL